MDWFERLTGFPEQGYEATRKQFQLQGRQLRSQVNGRLWDTGLLELASVQALRQRALSSSTPRGRLKVASLVGDVRALHQVPAYAGAVFQVASQFNLLEMVDPGITPEDGVTGYAHDLTQGPACALAAAAGTIYRNYFVPVDGVAGQTAGRQLNGLFELGQALAQATQLEVEELWTWRNGYALCTEPGLAAIAQVLANCSTAERDRLRGLLRVGVHQDVQVTDAPGPLLPTVTQVYCSALPVAYSGVASAHWHAFAQLVLEAAYEGTLWAAVANAQRGASSTVLLTRLGGGVFGNADGWIDAAIHRALSLAAGFALNVQLVNYREAHPSTRALVQAFGG
jgi:hypothetical protein